MMQNNPEVLFKRGTIVLVALVGALSLIISGGYFSLWTALVGVTLLLILRTYGRVEAASRLECTTFGAVWSLCALLIAGWLILLLLQMFSSYIPLFVFGRIGGIYLKPLNFYVFAFIFWLIAFLVVRNKEQQRAGLQGGTQGEAEEV